MKVKYLSTILIKTNSCLEQDKIFCHEYVFKSALKTNALMSSSKISEISMISNV